MLPDQSNEEKQTLLHNDSNKDNDKPIEFEISQSSLHESQILMKLAAPICLAMITEYLPVLIGFIYIGNLQNAEVLLSTLGLSRTLYVIVFMIEYGMISALYTLVPQAVGANKYNLCAVYIQRSFYLILIVSIPFNIILSFGGNIISFISFDPTINYNAINEQCRYFIFTSYIYLVLCILQRLPQTVNLNFQILICCAIPVLFSYPLCYFFISYLNMGASGFPLNVAFCHSINVLLTLCIYIKYDLLYALKPVSLRKVFDINGIKEYLVLALPGVVINGFETLINDCAIIYCSWIVSSELAISSGVVTCSIMSFIQFIGYSVSFSSSIRIGKYVGANMLEKAKESMICCKILAFIVSVILFIVLISARTEIPSIYTNEKNIIQLSSNLLYVIMIWVIFFIALYARYGIFRGIGKPNIAAMVVILSYFLVPFPLMFVLLFVYDWNNSLLYGTVSIFATIAIGCGLATIILEMYLLFKINWIEIGNEAEKRLEEV